MPPAPWLNPMDVITGIAAASVGGWLYACSVGNRQTAVTATAIFGTTFAAAYLTAPARSFPTAEAIANRSDIVTKGSDKVALVTGATSGIGIETARVLALHGVHVYLGGRSTKKLANTRETLLAGLPAEARISTLVCDLNDLTSVAAAAKEFLEKESRLDILINNAGIMAVPTRTATQQGLEAQVGVCHVAHVLLTQRLLPALKAAAEASGSARVVALSSSAHEGHEMADCLNTPRLETTPYTPWTAYGNAKVANLLFAKGFNDRYAEKAENPIYAFSVMPGGIFTGLQDSISLHKRINYNVVAPFFFKTVPQGAATSIYCATAPIADLVPGEYHDNCTPKPKALRAVLDYCASKGAGNAVDDCWDKTEALLKELGY